MKVVLPDYSLFQYQQPRQRHNFLVLYELPKLLDEYLTNLSKNKLKTIRDTYEPKDKSILPKVGNSYDDIPKIKGVQTSIQDFLSMSTQSIQDVNWQVSNQVDDQFYNQKIHWGGKRVYDDSLQIQFREYVQSPVTRLLLMWQRLVNDPVTNNSGYASDYKGKIIKLEIDPKIMQGITTVSQLIEKTKQKFFELSDDIITRQVIFEGAWPSNVPELGGQYNEDTLVTFTQQFTIDRYFEDNDWVRYLPQSDMIKSMIT